jgi:hypothetical protein
VVSEDAHLLTARIERRLRDAGIECEIVNLVPTQTAVLRRDRIVISIALALLTGLAWSYLLWLSADMSMGGMDMTGFRMISSDIGLMIPAHMPWRAMEFAFVFAMVARQQSRTAHVRFGSKADIRSKKRDVRFTPKSGHRNSASRCPLCATSRHQPPHSITSSATEMSVGGTVSPSAFAVLLLITSSNRVGVCTGRSAAFSPRRIRST